MWRRRGLLVAAAKALALAIVLGAPPAPAEAGPCCYWGGWYLWTCRMYCDCCVQRASVHYLTYCRDAYDCADNYCGTSECQTTSSGCVAPECSVCEGFLGYCA